MKGRPLTVSNDTFAVTQAVENGDSTMMIRELFENAINAAIIAGKLAHIRIMKINPSDVLGLVDYNSNKLVIWNNGVGMSARELETYSNLSSSSKQQSQKEHYGSGAKIAALKSNKKGLIYISCKDGEINYLILGQTDKSAQGEPIYGRFDLTGNGKEVENCTEDLKDAGFDNSEDWTMVVLCGNEFNQNTVTHPFGTKISTSWIINDIYSRFFKIANSHDFKIEFEVGHSKGKNITNKSFKTISEYIADKSQVHPDKITQEWRDVPGNEGIKIWYVSDGAWDIDAFNEDKGIKCRNGVKPTSCISNPATRGIFSGLVYKNEIYAVSGSQKGEHNWSVESSYLGIRAGAKYFRIFIQLPDNYDCQPDLYRKVLNQRVEDNGRDIKEVLSLRDFADVIYNNRPKWFIEKCAEFDTAQASNTDIRDRLTEELRKAQISQEQKIEKRNSKKRTNTSSSVKPKPSGVINRNKKRTIKTPKFEPRYKCCPEIKYIATEHDMDSYSGLSDSFKHRVGEYLRDLPGEGDVIYINCLSKQLDKINEWTDSEYERTLNDNSISYADESRNRAMSMLTWIVGLTVVRALAKEGTDGWAVDDINRITSAESLTLSADNWESLQSETKQDIKEECRQLKLKGSNSSSTETESSFSDAYLNTVQVGEVA
jgi:hypothetical protein